MKLGAWIHTGDNIPLDEQIALAADSGLQTIRCYGFDYAEKAAPALKRAGMSLLGGIHVDAEALAQDWRTSWLAITNWVSPSR